MKIGLLIIATNKYTQFLQNLITSADNFLLKNFEVTYFIFSNEELCIKSNRNIIYTKIEHKEWPWMTLGRYKIFSNNKSKLLEMEYLYYCDADMKFIDEVNDEILSKRVAIQHCGYYNQRGTPEVNKKSLAYVSNNEEMQYFAGGFNGGESEEYLIMSDILSNNIDIDYQNDIIALWHDESHINRYFIDNKPTLILDPSYCFHEGSDKPFTPKLLALSKNHSEIRY